MILLMLFLIGLWASKRLTGIPSLFLVVIYGFDSSKEGAWLYRFGTVLVLLFAYDDHGEYILVTYMLSVYNYYIFAIGWMGFRPVCGSIFNFSYFVIWCMPPFGFPWIGTIGAKIPIDLNKWEVCVYFRRRVVYCFSRYWISFLIAINSTMDWCYYKLNVLISFCNDIILILISMVLEYKLYLKLLRTVNETIQMLIVRSIKNYNSGFNFKL